MAQLGRGRRERPVDGLSTAALTPITDSWEKVAATYHEDVIGPFHPQAGRTLFHTAIDRCIEHSDVLDAGCGVGNLAWYVRAHRFQTRLHGLDASRAMIERAPADSYKSLVIGDLAHLPYRNGAFSVVVAVNSIMPPPGSRRSPREGVLHILSELRRVLRPAGKAVFVMPAYDSLATEVAIQISEGRTGWSSMLMDNQLRIGDTGFGVHRCMHDETTIAAEFPQSGFALERVERLVYSPVVSRQQGLMATTWDWLVTATAR